MGNADGQERLAADCGFEIKLEQPDVALAEKALKESEELSRAIVANAPIGIATSDASYHFVSANEAFCRILGYKEEEL